MLLSKKQAVFLTVLSLGKYYISKYFAFLQYVKDWTINTLFHAILKQVMFA